MNEHRRRVEALAEAFAEQFPGLPAGEVNEAFARFAVARGARVRVVLAEDGDLPGHGVHAWIRVFNVEGIHGYDVDFTADAFGDPALENPLVWRMDGCHPVSGVHRTLRVLPVVPPGG